jgi:hypothetical protein
MILNGIYHRHDRLDSSMTWCWLLTPICAEVRIEWSYTPTPPYFFIASWLNELRFPIGTEIFPFAIIFRSAVGPAIVYEMVPSLWVKRSEREDDYTLISNAWSCTSTPLYIFIAWWSIKHKDKFTSLLSYSTYMADRLCGLVVRVLVYRSGGPGSIPDTTRFSEKKNRKTSSGSGTGSTQPREYNWGATSTW